MGGQVEDCVQVLNMTAFHCTDRGQLFVLRSRDKQQIST